MFIYVKYGLKQRSSQEKAIDYYLMFGMIIMIPLNVPVA